MLSYMTSLVAHLDADCFYCSAERVRYRDLIGVPMGVLGNQGACVIAKSYEAKAKGIKTGDPIWDAVKLAPEMVFVKRDFRWYETLSRKMLDVVRSVSPLVEYYSIDEFFFDAKVLERGGILSRARELQQQLLDEVGVPVTIGISRSRSLAKLISDDAKPFGCKVLLEGIPEFLKGVSVEAITGIGARSAAKLVRRGIKTCYDFIQSDRYTIRKLLTVKGEKLWFELQGVPCEPIQGRRKAHKAISRGGSLGGRTRDMEVLLGWVVRNVERLVEELDYHRVNTERVHLILAGDHDSWGAKVDLCPTAGFEILCRALKQLLARAPRFVVSHMHLIAEKLTSRSQVQQVLFPEPEDQVAGVKAMVNGQIGRFALRSGDTLRASKIPKPTDVPTETLRVDRPEGREQGRERRTKR